MPGCYVLHLDSGRGEVGDEVIERFSAEVTARKLGEVEAVMKAGGMEVVVWVMTAPETEALAARLVRPGLEALVEELNLTAVASLEWVEDSEDEDDEEDVS